MAPYTHNIIVNNIEGYIVCHTPDKHINQIILCVCMEGFRQKDDQLPVLSVNIQTIEFDTFYS